MFQVKADDDAQRLTIRFSQRVTAEEMKHGLQKVSDALAGLNPGFHLLNDLSGMELMELACAPYVEEIMRLCAERKIGTVVRVIPDPRKDIGFNIMSQFHYGPSVKLMTYDNLRDALQSLGSATSAGSTA